MREPSPFSLGCQRQPNEFMIVDEARAVDDVAFYGVAILLADVHFFILPSTVSYCHYLILAPRTVQFLPELAQIFAILVVVLRVFFPCVQ